MHRFFVPPELSRGELVRLPEAEAHHAARVLRVRQREPVVLLDGAGGELRGVVESVAKREVCVRVAERIQHPPPGTEVTLIQAIAKGPAMEGLLHRAVELGCTRVLPLLAEHSVSRPGDREDKRGKWQNLATEAAKQSGNPWRTRIEAPLTPREWVACAGGFELLLIGSLLDAPQHPRTHFDAFVREQGRLPRTVGVLVGPEGDFSPEEYELFRRAGARSLSLGPLILRVETAATACLTIIQHELTAPRQITNSQFSISNSQ